MGFTCGIVGLPNVGKSTLFNALTAAAVPAENYPFCTIEPNVGVVALPDRRLDQIGRIYKSQKITPTVIEFVDIAGLVRGASKGEGLGNQFLSHIREVQAISHVVRCFEDENVVHVPGNVDPVRDAELVETELLLRDLETVEKKLSDAEKRSKSGDKKIKNEAEFYLNLSRQLAGGGSAMHVTPGTPDEKLWLHDLHLLTVKPVMYIANVDEEHLLKENDHVRRLREHALKENSIVVVTCAKMEAEIASMAWEERETFLHDLGVDHSGLDQIIRRGYSLLHLITFFTANEKEARARTVIRGTSAPRAAGEIHSDFEQGFIRAEVIKYDDLIRFGSEHIVKEKGLMHLQGKEYIVEDGDIVLFRFNI